MDRQRTDSLRLLLIEDNPDDAQLIQRLVAKEASDSVGFTWIDCLSDGIALLAEKEIDVLLLDLSLPDSNGFQTISRLREQAFEIPIVVLTGYDDESLARRAIQEGAQDYLIKGQVDSRGLLHSLRYAVRRKRADEQLARQAETLRELNEQLVLTSVQLHEAEETIAADLRNMRLLHELSGRLVTATDSHVFYQEILDAAIALTHADAGTLQILDPTTQELVLLAAKGLDSAMTERFQRVDAASHTSCGVALATGQRTFVDFDVPAEADPDGSLRAHVEAGYLSAQSTPQVSHSGRVVGMFSTHWRTRHRPTEHELRFLDLLARQAADWIEGKRAEEERERLQGQLAAERNWLRTVIDRSPVGIFLIEDDRGERVTVNRHAAELFGTPITPNGGIAQRQKLLFAADGSPLERAEQCYIRALAGEVVTAEERLIRRSDGQTVPVLVSAGPINDDLGTIQGAVVIFDDMTAIKELERLREEWLSIVTHDLRQPVTVIGGYADLFAMDLTASSEQRGEIEHIRSSVRNLSKMIEDLRDASQVETNRFTLKREWVDFPALVHAIVHRDAGTLGEGRVEVIVDDELSRLWIDPIRIEQVLTNLLTNAAKYGDPTTPIAVRLHRRGEGVEVSVTNQGPGIAPAEIPHVFSRFYRTHVAQRRRGGLGLGLYIAKGIVEAHGGHIWVESIPGRTTAFHFSIPGQGHPT